jgi:hypothetical protein
MPGWARHRHHGIGTELTSGGQSIPRIPLGSLTQAAKERVPLATREREIDVGNLRVPDQYLAALDSDLDTGIVSAPGWPTPRKTIAHYCYPHPVTSQDRSRRQTDTRTVSVTFNVLRLLPDHASVVSVIAGRRLRRR